MPDRIYLVHDGGTISPLDSSDYENEALLQKLVAEIPAVLAGGNAADDGWILVKREMEVPDSDDSSGRWSLDHLFLDRRGVPTLVEVRDSKTFSTRWRKRSRARPDGREVWRSLGSHRVTGCHTIPGSTRTAA
jgi:hypothetical protein